MNASLDFKEKEEEKQVDLDNKNESSEQMEASNKDESQKNSYVGLNVFIVISCVLNCFNPICLCWCIPMSIYVLYKVAKRERINGFVKFLSWILISPMVGIMLLNYNEKS